MYVDNFVAREPRPSAKVRTSMPCTQSLAIHDSRHTAGTVSAQWGPKCHVKARRHAGTSMQSNCRYRWSCAFALQYPNLVPYSNLPWRTPSALQD